MWPFPIAVVPVSFRASKAFVDKRCGRPPRYILTYKLHVRLKVATLCATELWEPHLR